MSVVQPFLGLLVFVAVAYLLSENRRFVRWQVIVAGLGAQFVLAYLFLQVPLFTAALEATSQVFGSLAEATLAGTSFVFGYLGGGATPFEVTKPENAFVFQFQMIPIVFVIGGLSAMLWHYGVLQRVIYAVAFCFQKLLGIRGEVAFASVAHIFISFEGSIITIQRFLPQMSRHNLMIVAVTAMSTVSGAVYTLFAYYLSPLVANPMPHVLTASLIHIPAGIMFAAIMVPALPKDQKALDQFNLKTVKGEVYLNGFDALFSGALRMLPVFWNIAVVVIVAMACVKLVDIGLSALPAVGGQAVTLNLALGYLFAPLAWLVGLPVGELHAGGSLIGTKTVLNEFVALASMGQLPVGTLSPNSAVVMTYVLTSFANIGTAAIIAGVLFSLIPKRREDVIQIATKSILAGLLATCCTGAVIATLLGLGLV